MSFFLTGSCLRLGFVSKQEGSSRPPAASSISSCDSATVAREAEAVAVEELSGETRWGCADATLRSLVGWASLAASSCSSDFQIWVACSWYTVLTASAVTDDSGVVRTCAYIVDETLAREAAWSYTSCLATGSVRNKPFTGVTYALAVLISLDAEAGRGHGSNTSSTVADD